MSTEYYIGYHWVLNVQANLFSRNFKPDLSNDVKKRWVIVNQSDETVFRQNSDEAKPIRIRFHIFRSTRSVQSDENGLQACLNSQSEDSQNDWNSQSEDSQNDWNSQSEDSQNDWNSQSEDSKNDWN